MDDAINDGNQPVVVLCTYGLLYLQVLFVIITVIITVIVLNDGAKHWASLSQTQHTKIGRLQWINQAFATAAQAIAKISVALLVLRFTGPNTVWRKLFLYTCIVSTLVIFVVNTILSYAQCNPPRALWEKVPNASCWKPKIFVHYANFSGSKSLLARKTLSGC